MGEGRGGRERGWGRAHTTSHKVRRHTLLIHKIKLFPAQSDYCTALVTQWGFPCSTPPTCSLSSWLLWWSERCRNSSVSFRHSRMCCGDTKSSATLMQLQRLRTYTRTDVHTWWTEKTVGHIHTSVELANTMLLVQLALLCTPPPTPPTW